MPKNYNFFGLLSCVNTPKNKIIHTLIMIWKYLIPKQIKRVDAPNTNGERLFLQSYMNNCAADHTTQWGSIRLKFTRVSEQATFICTSNNDVLMIFYAAANHKLLYITPQKFIEMSQLTFGSSNTNLESGEFRWNFSRRSLQQFTR